MKNLCVLQDVELFREGTDDNEVINLAKTSDLLVEGECLR